MFKTTSYLWFGLCVMAGVALAQGPPPEPPPNIEELQETIRFIRLAESRKRLSFNEETLLQINEMLDTFEAEKFRLLAEERSLSREIHEAGNNPEKVSQASIDRLLQARNALAQSQDDMWKKARELLTQEEFTQFFIFYDRFQHEVRRRLEQVKRQRGPKMNGGGPRRFQKRN